MNKDVCVYILTHNRPNDILRSLNSVRKQDFPNLKIVVSDNSDNDTTTELLKDLIRSDARINYIRRGKECSSANAHFNYILATNTHEYFMLFHDDDEMLPNMNIYRLMIHSVQWGVTHILILMGRIQRRKCLSLQLYK